MLYQEIFYIKNIYKNALYSIYNVPVVFLRFCLFQHFHYNRTCFWCDYTLQFDFTAGNGLLVDRMISSHDWANLQKCTLTLAAFHRGYGELEDMSTVNRKGTDCIILAHFQLCRWLFGVEDASVMVSFLQSPKNIAFSTSPNSVHGCIFFTITILDSNTKINKIKHSTGDMDYQLLLLAIKHDNLNLIQAHTWWKRRTDSHKLFSDMNVHTCTCTHRHTPAPIHTHIHTCSWACLHALDVPMHIFK